MSVLGQASQEFDNIITVGAAERFNDEIALSKAYNRTEYSSYGYGLDIVAPGGTIDNPTLSLSGEEVGSMAGTSVATAKVTGAISQVWAANPSLSYRQVIEIIKNTATDLGATDFDLETGAGLLNMVAAVQLAKATQPEEEVAKDLQFIPLTWNGEGLVTPMERAANPTSSITGTHQSNGNPEQPITWETFLNIFGAYSSPNWLSFLRNTFDTFYSPQSQNPTTAKNKLIFYDRDSGDNEFYRVNDNGSMTRISQGSGWRKTWDMIIPGNFNGDGKSNLLFYDRDTGAHEFYRVNDNGSMTRIGQGSGWRKTWDMIIPGDFNGDGKTTLLFYDRDRGDYEFYRVNNNGSMTRISQGSGWRKTWDMIIPGDFNGDGKNTLLFYDRDRGDYEFYRVNNNGSITRISQGSGWRKTWDMIIPEAAEVKPPVKPPDNGGGKYYPDLASLTKVDWNYQSKDNRFFDGQTGNGESLPSVKQIYSDLSQGIFGAYKAMTAGYFDNTNYNGTHYGIDMAGLAGNPVKTVVGGTTTLVQNIAGNYFIGVKGDDGKLWIYGHLENYSVGIGQRVEAGTKIGTIFDGAYFNGYWMAQHLHLEVHEGHAYNRAKSISPLEAYWKLRNS
jgi:hypothetical protein